jgi:fibronectin-binding autotransporter adhesin
VTLNSIVQPASVTFESSENSYTISGTGSIAGPGSLRLLPGNTSTVTLSTANTYTGGTTVIGGVLKILPTGTSGSALGSGAFSINGGAVQLAASQSSPTNITSLSISNNGTLDINNNHVFINYGSGPDPIASIAALLAAGYAGGAWNGIGGIDTSAPLVVGGLTYGIGYADGADAQHLATGLTSGTIEIKYTLLGDADLNGIVNGIDFGILAANFNKGITGWDEGDFDYNNIVNGLDFGDLAANFNKGAAGTAEVAALDAFAAANGLLADVPEPTTLGLVLVAGAGLLGRRRRVSL